VLFGPTLIKSCSYCGEYFDQQTLMSGNSFGAITWTDGKTEAPMLPETPWMVKCPHCSKLLWLREQETVAEVERADKRNHYANSKPYEVLKLKDYWRVLEGYDLEQQQELYLRIRAWWKGNDKRRGSEIKSTLSSKEASNLRALEALLDTSHSPERLMAAEIKRELCEFNDTEKLLIEVMAGEFEHAAIAIADLAIRKDPYVAEIKEPA